MSATPDTQGPSGQPFDPASWAVVPGFDDLTDITYHRHVGEGREYGIVRVAFDRPEVRNAFRPHTVDELYRVLDHARRSPDVGTILLTGNGPSPKDGGWAFCSGGDQRIRGRSGYQYATTHDDDVAAAGAETVDAARAGRRVGVRTAQRDDVEHRRRIDRVDAGAVLDPGALAHLPAAVATARTTFQRTQFP